MEEVDIEAFLCRILKNKQHISSIHFQWESADDERKLYVGSKKGKETCIENIETRKGKL